MSAAFTLDVKSETYLDVKQLIFDTAFKFSCRYGGELDELIGEANAIFMRAYNTYEVGRDFETWLRFLIWRILLEGVRRKAMRNARLPRVSNAGLEERPVRSRFNLRAFLLDLSEDARLVALLAVEQPLDLMWAARSKGFERWEGDKKTPHPELMRSGLREVLKDFEWTSDRIASAFNEIGRALP